MPSTRQRAAFTGPDVLVVIAIIGLFAAGVLVAVVSARLAAGRIESLNNLRQIALACHVYADANNSAFLGGNDKNNFSAFAHLLPFLEQQNIYESIDFSKPSDDKANDKARKTRVKLLISPLDPLKPVVGEVAPTNYLFCAGSKPGLKDNNGVFSLNAALTLGQITSADGTSNTMIVAETLRGDGGTKAVAVQRQHVLFKPEKPKEPPPAKVDADLVKQLLADLGSNQFAARKKAAEELEKLGEAIEPDLKKALAARPALEISKRLDDLVQKIDSKRRDRLSGLAGLKEDSGLQDWKDGKNIVGDRGASWLDGRFLQSTFSANRALNDPRPDVNAQGFGGYSSMRNAGAATIPVAFADGHVQNIPVTLKADVWKALATWNGGEAVQLP